MKTDNFRFLLLLAAISAVLFIQPNSLIAQNDNDSIHISTDFLKELDNTFGFKQEKPKIAHINTIEAIKPDSEMLHQWVMDPKANGIATVSKYPTMVNIPGLSNGEFAKGVVVWRSKKNPDLMIINSGNGSALSGIDVNGFLSQYLTQEGRTLRHSRDLAKSCKDIMDKFFPIDGNALFTKDDSLALVKKNK